MLRSLIGVTMVLVSTSAFSASKFISKADFTSAIVGKTISSTDKKGLSFSATFKPDGTGDFQKKGKPPATFKWRYSGQTVCWDFGDFRECNKVEIVSPISARFYDAKSGKLNNTYAVE